MGNLEAAAPPSRLTDVWKIVDEIKVGHAAAVQVLSAIDDPNATSQRIASAVEADIDMTTQILRLANSAFYGVSGRVGNVPHAVTIIGFSAVRSMAAVSASGLGKPGIQLPPQFWHRAALSAAGSSAAARDVGVPSGDAFAAGLLHNIGLALLHRADPAAHLALLDVHGADGHDLRDAEEELFGMGHDTVGAKVLEMWHFPTALVSGVADHHDLPEDGASGFLRVLAAGNAIASMVDEEVVLVPEPLEVLEHTGIPTSKAGELVEVASERVSDILASLPRTA